MVDRRKLKDLIVFVAWRMQEAPHFGSTKLNKVLHRAETIAYQESGRTITGFHYQKNQYGPTLRAYLPIVAELEEERRVRRIKRRVGKRSEDRVEPIGDHRPRSLSQEELDAAERAIEELWETTAERASDDSHKTAAWFATRFGETIPWELTLVEAPGTIIPFSDEETARAERAIRRHQRRLAADPLQSRIRRRG